MWGRRANDEMLVSIGNKHLACQVLVVHTFKCQHSGNRRRWISRSSRPSWSTASTGQEGLQRNNKQKSTPSKTSMRTWILRFIRTKTPSHQLLHHETHSKRRLLLLGRGGWYPPDIKAYGTVNLLKPFQEKMYCITPVWKTSGGAG